MLDHTALPLRKDRLTPAQVHSSPPQEVSSICTDVSLTDTQQPQQQQEAVWALKVTFKYQ